MKTAVKCLLPSKLEFQEIVLIKNSHSKEDFSLTKDRKGQQGHRTRDRGHCCHLGHNQRSTMSDEPREDGAGLRSKLTLG
mgnify:FL=1